MIEIEKDNCIGCGACQALLSDIFEFDDEGLAKVKVPETASFNDLELKEITSICPTDAIIAKKKVL